MASVFPGNRTHISFVTPHGAPRLARAMSHHASGALLTFALLQVAGVVAFNSLPGGNWLPFIALGLLLLIAVPFSRRLERRWTHFSDTALPSPGLMVSFRRDRARLWRLACIVPTLWLGLFAVVAEAATL